MFERIGKLSPNLYIAYFRIVKSYITLLKIIHLWSQSNFDINSMSVKPFVTAPTNALHLFSTRRSFTL